MFSLFCNILKVFTVVSDQFNVPLLNKSIISLNNKKHTEPKPLNIRPLCYIDSYFLPITSEWEREENSLWSFDCNIKNRFITNVNIHDMLTFSKYVTLTTKPVIRVIFSKL